MNNTNCDKLHVALSGDAGSRLKGKRGGTLHRILWTRVIHPIFYFFPFFLLPLRSFFLFYLLCVLFCIVFFVSLFFSFLFFFCIFIHDFFLWNERKKKIVEWTSSSYCRNYWSFSHGNLINLFFFLFVFVCEIRSKLDRTKLKFLIKHSVLYLVRNFRIFWLKLLRWI